MRSPCEDLGSPFVWIDADDASSPEVGLVLSGAEAPVVILPAFELLLGLSTCRLMCVPCSGV